VERLNANWEQASSIQIVNFITLVDQNFIQTFLNFGDLGFGERTNMLFQTGFG
jgi:hypothetical protein